MIDRERSVNVEKMSQEEVDVLGIQLGNKINAIRDEALAKANAILKIYGAKAEMMIQITELPDALHKSMEPKKKGRKPRKNANLSKEPIS